MGALNINIDFIKNNILMFCFTDTFVCHRIIYAVNIKISAAIYDRNTEI